MVHLTSALLKLCNLRTLVVAGALWLMLGCPVPAFMSAANDLVDGAVFRLGLGVSELPAPNTQVTVVHVSEIEFVTWAHDLPGAKRLQQLINTIAKDDNSTGPIGVVLEQPISLMQSEAETILNEVHQQRSATAHLYEESQSLLDRRQQLTRALQTGTVVIGLHNAFPLVRSPVRVLDGGLALYPEWLREWLWQRPPEPNGQRLASLPALNSYTIAEAEGLAQPLFWAREQHIAPSFILRYLQAAAAQAGAAEAEAAIFGRWRRDHSIHLDRPYRLSYDGSFVPLYGQPSGIRASLRQLTLNAALAADNLDGWILVGRDGSKELDKVAQTLVSIGDNAVLIKPVWWPALEKALILLIVVFCCFALPVLRWQWRVGVSLAVMTGLVISAVAAQALLQSWLPVAQLVFLLLAGFILMNVWTAQNQRAQRILARADATSFGWAEQLQALGEHKSAFRLLRHCETSSHTLQSLYEVAQAQESQDRLTDAQATLQEIRRRKKRYLDVNQKLKSLASRIRGDNTDTGTGSAPKAVLPTPLGKTQALTQVFDKSFSLGRYEVQKELGRGASGTVYLAFDPKISRPVAIKALNYAQFSEAELNDVKARFYREAEAAGRLSHPNIVQVFDVGEQDELAYIAMDVARGVPLSEFIRKDRLLSAVEVYRIVAHVADALAYAHSNHVVHRDIKPSNILYNEHPYQVKVSDFGIARLVDHSHTSTGEILGSPLYMAPEQLLGQKVSHSADIFSLGVMFYQLLTGQLPFDGDNLASLSYEIVNGKHRSVRSIRKELPVSATRITNLALQKKPSDRYASASAMAEALRKSLKRDFSAELKETSHPT